MANISKITMLLLILLVFCAINQPAEAETSVYVFGPDQSTVFKTGGFAGVNITYAVTGQFQLTVDLNSRIASFEIVDANLTDDTGLEYGQSLKEIFNMTGLAGTVVNYKTIEFEGKTADGTESDVSLSLKLSIKDDSVHLTGKTTPPPNSADMFFYDVNAVATKKYAGGTGEPNNPYQIATAEDLMLLGENPEDYDKHFILTDDIDLDPNLPGRKVFDKAIIASENIYDDPEVFGGTSFSGHFDGNGHVISNLNIQGSRYLGLFGRLEIGSVISNLGLEAVDVNGTGPYVGGLVGCNLSSEIAECNSSGKINGGLYVGGLVGYNSSDSSISSSSSTGMVRGEWDIGGLVGMNFGKISSSHSTGTISGISSFYVGGLVGSNGGNITTSYSTGTVTGYSGVGGLVGGCFVGSSTRFEDPEYISSITASYSTSTVIGESRDVGGLVGKNSGFITASYSTGTVSGDLFVGGLVGSNRYKSISSSYSTGKVSGNDYIGGLVGSDSNKDISDGFWDIQTSGLTYSASGIGKTTDEMQTANTFLEAGWDFVNEAENGTEDIWKIAEGLDYPRFWWEKYGGGTGEPNDPYLICTAEHLNTLGDEPNDYDKHFKLIADVDLGDYAPDKFNFIGESIPFTGVFDGNGHSISNFHYTDGDRSPLSGGLFSMVADPNAQIRNLTLIDPNISGKVHVGPLVGWMQEGAITNCHVIGGCVNAVFPALVTDDIGGLVGLVDRGTITSCTSSCRVNGHNSVGGLVGYAGKTDQGGCFITNCRATGDVTGESLVGGLVGIGPHSIIICSCATGQVVGGWQVGGLAGSSGGGVTGRYITDCYATGSAAGRHAVGGLIGTHGNIPISRCYAAGQVINLSGEPDTSQHYIGGLIGSEDHADSTCFWDIETSGRTTSKGGIGLTTAEMQTAATFLEAGWDFVGETDNGTEDIWSICEGTNYPRFVWQIPVGDFVCPDGVTIEDFSFFMDHWLDDNCDSSNDYCQDTDLDQSGTVDVIDLEIFFENWPAEQ